MAFLDSAEFANERELMVEQQLAGRGLRDKRLLQAMGSVPRHCFVPEAYRHLAYTDGPLPIGRGQTISQPYMVALMTDLLTLKGSEVVLEVGTGSGYQAAVLAALAHQVYTIERHASLVKRVLLIFAELEINNVIVIAGDGSRGLPEHALYDGIIVTAAAPRVPRPLLEQLKPDGRLVLPVGGEYGQHLQVWTRDGEAFRSRVVVPVAFVPLRGEFGWSSREWGEKEQRL
jgi:protein-L-isoaspartate(D-aspartate) O-methyltransferase